MRNRLFLMVGVVCLASAFESKASAQSTDELPRYEVGAQFSSLTIKEPSYSSGFRTEPGFGARFTYNFNRSIAAEAQIDFYPNDNGARNYETSGRALQGLFGIKAGRRFERFGIFAKARPGFVRYSQIVNGYDTPTSYGYVQPRLGAKVDFATDFGGVLEFYPSRRIVTRLDIGDTLIRYRERTITVPLIDLNGNLTAFTSTIPASKTNNFQFSAGIGLRF